MIIDIVSILFVIAFACMTMRKGAVGAAVNLAGIILSLFVSMLIYPVVTALIYMTPVPDAVSEPIEQAIIREGSSYDISQTIDAMPDFIKNGVDEALESGAINAAAAVADAVARTIINIIAFVVIAAAVRVLILLLTGALKLSTKLPVIKQCNKLLGLLCGLAAALVVLWVASAVLCALAPSNEFLAGQVLDSYIVAIMSLFAPF